MAAIKICLGLNMLNQVSDAYDLQFAVLFPLGVRKSGSNDIIKFVLNDHRK